VHALRLQEKLLFNAQPLPEMWVKMMCRHRERFGGVAICTRPEENFDCAPETLFIPMIMMQSPFGIWFLRATRTTNHIPNEAQRPHGVLPELDNLAMFYDYDMLEFVSHRNIPISMHNHEIYVACDVLFRGDFVHCTSAPIPFQTFVAGLSHKPVHSERERKLGKVTDDVARRLLDEFPWMRLEDIMNSESVSKFQARKESSKNEKIAEQLLGDECCDEVYDAVMADLLQVREKYQEGEGMDSHHFYIRILGGKWTKKFKGVCSDAVVCVCREYVAPWAKVFKWPRYKTFTFAKYGQLEAVMMAREWARRGNHWFDLYMNSGDDDGFAYSADNLSSYVDSEKFIDWALTMPLDADVYDCIIQVRNTVPTNPA
jgi:hypothetical protein